MLQAQVTEQIKAELYETTQERQDYRNGYYSRDLLTRVGTITLKAPGLEMANSLLVSFAVISKVNRLCY
nr:MAG: hypothetical protein DIU64_07315 [Caldicoprobacter oshimai]